MSERELEIARAILAKAESERTAMEREEPQSENWWVARVRMEAFFEAASVASALVGCAMPNHHAASAAPNNQDTLSALDAANAAESEWHNDAERIRAKSVPLFGMLVYRVDTSIKKRGWDLRPQQDVEYAVERLKEIACIFVEREPR